MNIYQLLLAFVFAHSLHAIGESTNVLSKLERLTNAVHKKKLKPYPMNIDTRAKSYALGFGVIAAVTVITYAMLSILDFTNTSFVLVALSLLVVTELITTVKIDKYHVEIEKLIKKFNKK